MENFLVDNTYLLKKFPGKGGWTYAEIPEVAPDPHAWFGWVRVRGHIDGVEIKSYNLQPMGNGKLFLPVKAEIRKKIKKEAGDTVHVVLYADDLPLEIPTELAECLATEPGLRQAYDKLPEGERKNYLEWIYSAKKEETKVERMVVLMEKLSAGRN
jgi:hypothetical protein